MNRASPFATTVAIAIAIVSLASTAPAYGVVTEPTPGTSGYQPWPTARPGGDQQATEQQNFNTYYSNPVYTATTPPDLQRNADAEDYLLDIFGDLENIAPELDAVLRAPIELDLISAAHQLPYILDASGPGIAPLPASDAHNLDLFDRWLQSVDLTPEGLTNPDPATRQAIRELEDTVVPDYLADHYYSVYLHNGHPPADAAALAAQRRLDVLMSARTSSGLFSSAQVTQLRNWYYDGVDYLGSDRRPRNTRRNFVRVGEHAGLSMQLRYGSAVSGATIRRAVEGVGPYAPGRADRSGVPYPDPNVIPIPNQCPAGYTCPPLADPPA